MEAFRTIERFLENPDPDQRHWALLAFQESKMLIEGSLLDENRVMISTGMGGRDNKLRYFIAFLLKEEGELDDFKRKIVEGELSFIFKKHDVEAEELHFLDRYISLRLLIPINVNIQQLFEEALVNCNQFGNFLMNNYIVTNVKELSESEVAEIINKQDDDDDDDENDLEINLDLPYGSKS